MLPVKDLAMVPAAIRACDDHELKREILCSLGSDYNRDRSKNVNNSKKLWTSYVNKKATLTLKKIGFPESLIEETIRFVPAIGRRMVIWAEYHEHILGLPREYSVKFLNSSFFTQRGIIDNRKAAEALIADENLSIRLRYKLACLHCFVDHIHVLHSKMSKEDMEEFYNAQTPSRIIQPGLVKFWTYCLMNDVDKLREGETLDRYMLEMIVESGSKSAFEYWLKTPSNREKGDIVNIALKTVLKAVSAGNWTNIYGGSCAPEGIPFGYRESLVTEESWTPSDFYIDAVFFLLSEMNEGQRIKFLKTDIDGTEYGHYFYHLGSYSKVLDFFLNWPYQDYFMKTASLMWKFLPEINYVTLLLKIIDRIEPDECSLEYVEGKSYDYKGLLRKFWERSPENYKRFVLGDNCVIHQLPGMPTVKTCTLLLNRLFFSSSNVAYDDIQMILASANHEQRENIFYSSEWIDICVQLMSEKWEVLNHFVINRLLNKGEADTFKKYFTSVYPAQSACVELMERDEWKTAEAFIKWCTSPEEEAELRSSIVFTEAWANACVAFMDKEEWDKLDQFLLKYFQSNKDVNKFKSEFADRKDVRSFCLSRFIGNGRWDAAESFLKRSDLSDEEINEVQRKMVVSPEGIKTCCCLFQRFEGAGAVDRFIRWHNPPEEEVKELKMNLIFSNESIKTCAELAIKDKLELADDFVNYCLSSEEQMKELKKLVAYTEGCEVLKFILVHCDEYYSYFKVRFAFECGKWVAAEKFLSWCFSREEDKNAYKKRMLLQHWGRDIHFSFISWNQWDEAEALFDWLGLSSVEVKEMKEMLFHDPEAKFIFCKLLCSKEGDQSVPSYGSKQETIEFFLQWYLTDIETITKCVDVIKLWDFGETDVKLLHESLDLAVTHIKDLYNKPKEKRESEFFSPKKRFRI